MKTIKALIVLLLLSASFSQEIYGQTIDKFFEYEGVKLIADFAHPTNTFSSASFYVGYDHVAIGIYYEECYTEVKIIRDGDFFTNIQVIKDTDWFSPFAATGMIKDIIWDAINSDSDREELSKFEEKINKRISDMSGKDLTCLFLTLSWWAY